MSSRLAITALGIVGDVGREKVREERLECSQRLLEGAHLLVHGPLAHTFAAFVYSQFHGSWHQVPPGSWCQWPWLFLSIRPAPLALEGRQGDKRSRSR